MKRIDPIDRALDAYRALDETQRAVFTGVLTRLDKPSVAEPKRGPGRPAGSKTRNIAAGNPAAVLAGKNAAEGEGL